MSYTPGPWHWNNSSYDGLTGSNGEAVLRWEPYEGMWLALKTEHANARLIAAAPELLEALQNILSYAAFDLDDIGYRNEVAQARAAVAKATGDK